MSPNSGSAIQLPAKSSSSEDLVAAGAVERSFFGEASSATPSHVGNGPALGYSGSVGGGERCTGCCRRAGSRTGEVAGDAP